MKQLLRESLIAGAIGMSTGLVYAPASYSDSAELYELATVLAEFDSVMFVHLRSESNRVIEAFEEVADACEEAGCRLHLSHIKTAGADNWHLTPALISRINHYVNDRHLRITADLHPYVAGSTMASVFLPGWFQDGDIEETLRRLQDPTSIERARLQILNDVDSWDNWWRFSSGWQGIRFTECLDKTLIGIPLDQLIVKQGIDDIHSFEAFEWFFSVLASSRMQASIISFNNTEDNIAEFLKLPFISLCTDGLINPHGQPHPRTFGSFPRLFNRFVRDLGVLDLEQAVRVCALNGRSVIKDSRITDFVIFNPSEIRDEATFETPTNLSSGIVAEYINGNWIDIPRFG
jgi:N-acyl-D-aspartate/D-glutamate deacylase